MGYHICIEIQVHLGSAENHHIHHVGNVTLAVIIVACERTGHDMVWIITDRSHAVEIKGLTIEDIIHQAFFEHADKILIAASPGKACLNSFFPHDISEIVAHGKGCSSCSGLERKPVVYDSGHIT